MFDADTEFPRFIPILCIFLPLFCSSGLLSINLSSRSLIHSSASTILLFISLNVFLILFTEPFISALLFLISVLRVSLMSSSLFSNPMSSLMIIALNSPSGMWLHSGTWLCSCTVFLFGIDFSVSSFCLSLYMFLHVKKVSYVFLSWKKWLYEEVLWCPEVLLSPVHQNLALQKSILCVAYALLLCLSYFSFWYSHLHWLSTFCGLCLLSVVFIGPRQARSVGSSH